MAVHKMPYFHLISWCGIAENYTEIVPFHKISTPGTLVKLRHFTKGELTILETSQKIK